ncbi:MAG: TolC family protein, partial [Planctomycetes bacterium]|nr:TolC family protein [Planctomycetota bacterium]
MRFPFSTLISIASLACLGGCAAARTEAPVASIPVRAEAPAAGPEEHSQVVLVEHRQAPDPLHEATAVGPFLEEFPPPIALAELEASAAVNNPTLRRMQQETAAAWARVGYVGKLPDPTFGFNIFGHPIETAAGSQRANFSLMQMIPWLSRLGAQEQQAGFEAWVRESEYAAERLRVIGDIRAAWFKLYVLAKQIETIEANKTLLQSLIDTANARVAAGGPQGDVLLGMLELSSLEEQLIDFRRQIVAVKAELNRLAGRDPWTPIAAPSALDASLPAWTPKMLREIAIANQPAIAAAQFEAEATRWGVEVARLKRRPDVSLNAGWFVMDDNRPPSAIVDVGEDAW